MSVDEVEEEQDSSARWTEYSNQVALGLQSSIDRSFRECIIVLGFFVCALVVVTILWIVGARDWYASS